MPWSNAPFCFGYLFADQIRNSPNSFCISLGEPLDSFFTPFAFLVIFSSKALVQLALESFSLGLYAKVVEEKTSIYNMGDDVVSLIVLGVISWTIAFVLIRKIFSKRSFEFCNRVVSTIHAVLAVTLASLTVEDWSRPVSPSALNSLPKQRQALAVTVSYLVYDLLCCLFDERFSLDNAVHHLVSIVGIGAGLVYQMGASEMVAALFITEISSPFLHAREMLKELGFRDTDLNLAADISFAVTFSIARMVGGPYLTFVTLTANYPILIKATALGLQLVSAFWFYKIVKMVNYKLTKRRKNVISSSLHGEKLTEPVVITSFTKMD